jgi:hypothetical protein
MRPTQPTTPGELRVMRWLLVGGGAVVLVLLATTWWSKSGACTQTCIARAAPGGELQFVGGGRFTMGTQCVCLPVAGKK